MKSFFFSIVLVAAFILPSAAQNDPMDALYAHFKAGNSKEIAKSFAESVELTVFETDEVYSKAQAEQILRDFFVKHSPVSFTKVHSVGSSNVKYRYGVIILTTKKGKYRVSISMNRVEDTYLISELKIDSEK